MDCFHLFLAIINIKLLWKSFLLLSFLFRFRLHCWAKVGVCLSLQETSKHFSKVIVPFETPSSSGWEFQVLQFLLSLVCCDFYLHFLDGSHVLIGHLYIFHLKSLFNLLLIFNFLLASFKLDCLFYYYQLVQSYTHVHRIQFFARNL